MEVRWSKKAHERWRTRPAKGRHRYILVHGGLAYGITMFLGIDVIPAVFRWQVPLSSHSNLFLPFSFIFWFAGGLLWGSIQWANNEANFRLQEPD